VENMDSIAKDDEQGDDLKTEAMADLEKAPPQKRINKRSNCS